MAALAELIDRYEALSIFWSCGEFINYRYRVLVTGQSFSIGIKTNYLRKKLKDVSCLVAVRQFDPYVLLIGTLFGFLLQKIRINPALFLVDF